MQPAAELYAKALNRRRKYTNGGIVSEFGRIYVMSGEISDVRRKLSHALEMRERARYEASADIRRVRRCFNCYRIG